MKKSVLLTANPPPWLPQYKLDLILPRRHFISGESIPFEIKLDNPDCFNIQTMSIKLMQNTIYTKFKRNLISSQTRPALKFRSAVLVHLSNAVYISSAYAYGGSWIDSLRIPELLPPTTQSPFERHGSEQISEIQYFLKVEVNKSELFGAITKEFPIEIGMPRSLTRKASNENQRNVPDILTDHVESRRNSVDYDTVSLMSENGGGLGANKDFPPRYSMLSLPILGSSRSNSVETLPPHYDDTAKFN